MYLILIQFQFDIDIDIDVLRLVRVLNESMT